MEIVADAIGLIVLSVLVTLCAMIVPASEVTPLLWLFVYAALAVIGWSFWRRESAPASPAGWLGLAAAGMLLGALSFAADMFIGHRRHPGVPLFQAAETSGSFLGFGLTVTFFPALIFIAIAGLARSVYRSWRKSA
jgi:hypothetical protein